MTCFRRKGKSFVHTAPRIKSAVFRFLTGFPCSAEQECVSIYVSGSRICHKVSRVYREPPNGGGFPFPIPPRLPAWRHQGNLCRMEARQHINGSQWQANNNNVVVSQCSPSSQVGLHQETVLQTEGGTTDSPLLKACVRGDYTNQVIQTHSACFFLASC